MLDTVNGGRNRVQPRGGQAGGKDGRRAGAGRPTLGGDEAIDCPDEEIRVGEVEGGEQPVLPGGIRGRKKGLGLPSQPPSLLPSLALRRCV